MQKFIKQLAKIIESNRLITDPLLCYAYSTDASMYRLVPQLVIIARTNQEIQQILLKANQHKVSVTFRAAGTSLSGQAVTDQVLIILDNSSWKNYTIHDSGQSITLEPGIIASDANIYLKQYHTKLGPDPASIHACKIGGIVANNSSGMCCGVKRNTYQTMQNIKCILANGNILDTSTQFNRDTFSNNNTDIINGIIEIRDYIKQNNDIYQFIHHKYKIKNTCGYAINSFIDYHDPIDILAHLMIGSEGTLGFISQITYNCIPDDQYKAVSLIYLYDLNGLINLVLQLESQEISAMELLDITSLEAITKLSASLYIPKLEIDTTCVLIELSASNESELIQKINNMQNILEKHNIYYQVPFTMDKKIINALWDLRKGILPIIGANRPEYTTVIIEDIAVTLNHLPGLTKDLRLLFSKYNYINAAIFGHILDGNIHFVFTPSFTTQELIDNYKNFMTDMAYLVIKKYNGSLKAEHGTGRNIAPFVEFEWGTTIYNIMWKIKNLLDPNNILNKDVILSHDPHIHIKNIKELNSVDPLIDKCIECGFCEKVCPSKNLSFTPRQRISTYRYLQKMKQSLSYKRLVKTYKHNSINTCATTGMCYKDCPVGINTGEFILQLKQNQSNLFTRIWASNYSVFIQLTRNTIKIINLIRFITGKKYFTKVSYRLHQVIPIIPVYPVSTPSPAPRLYYKSPNQIKQNLNRNQILYIPSCSNRIFADTIKCDKDNAILQLLTQLDYEILFPKKLDSMCCGQIFKSRGNQDLAQIKIDEISSVINSYDIPVLIDNSSCTKHVLEYKPNSKIMTIIDLVFINLNNLTLTKKYNKIALHVDCSSKNYYSQIIEILNKCANEVIIPHDINCCGFAGNMGFTTPELNQSALQTLSKQIKECDIGVTFNRNCQIGLSEHGKKTYLSLAEIVLQCLI